MTESIRVGNARDLIDARETSVVAASVVAIALAKIYWISRIGFDNPIAPVLVAAGLSLFVIATPLVVTRLLGGYEKDRWWTSQPFMMLLSIVIMALAGMAASETGRSAAPLIAAIGIGCAVWTFVRWIRRDSLRSSLAFVLGVGVFAIWCAGVIWGSRYKMPLFWETLTYKANIHHDTFYYGSIANMIDTYGVPSTGLDGLPVIRYHFGSMWWYVKLADLMNVEVLTFYSLGYTVIILPALFAAILLFGCELRAAFGVSEAVSMRRDWRVWLVFLAATAGFIPTSALDAFAIWNSNAFISESYLGALPIFFLLLSIAVVYWRSGEVRGVVLLTVVLPLIVAALGFLKLSLMALAFLLMLYLAVRLGWLKRPIVLASIVITVIATGVTYHFVALQAQNQGFSPLDFMRYDVRDGWQQFFPLMHLLWTWVYVALRIWEDGARDTSQLVQSIKSRRLIDAEVLLVLAIGGFFPGELVTIHGGSAVYFSDVQRWVAIAFLIARMPVWAARWASHRKSIAISESTGWRGVRLSRLIGFFVLVPFVVTLLVNLVQWPLRDLRANLTLRRELIVQGGGQPAGIRSLANREQLERGVRQSTYYPIITEMRNIARLPAAQRRQTALFIPQSNTQYWSMFTSDGRCSFTPLIAPAVASVAMIDGMPAYGCKVTDQYNMDAYHPREAEQSARDAADDAVCAKARSRGFREVIVLGSSESGAPRRRRVACYLL